MSSTRKKSTKTSEQRKTHTHTHTHTHTLFLLITAVTQQWKEKIMSWNRSKYRSTHTNVFKTSWASKNNVPHG